MNRPPALGLAIAVAILILDQLSKWWIVADVLNPLRIIEITPFFNIVLVRNLGASFGLLGGAGDWGPWVLTAFAVAIATGLGIWLARTNTVWVATALGLVIGGAAGNVTDRLRFGAVIDFLDFHLGDYHWPAFNLADSAITVGVAILLADALIGRRRAN